MVGARLPAGHGQPHHHEGNHKPDDQDHTDAHVCQEALHRLPFAFVSIDPEAESSTVGARREAGLERVMHFEAPCIPPVTGC
ncbi:MAG: hypothetical protein Kow00120_17720 [Anaerolineae bacterium]